MGSTAPAPGLAPKVNADDQYVIFATWSGGSGYLQFYPDSDWPSGGGNALVANKNDATKWNRFEWDGNWAYYGVWLPTWSAWAYLAWSSEIVRVPPGIYVQLRYWSKASKWSLTNEGLLIPNTISGHRVGYYPAGYYGSKTPYFTYTLNAADHPLKCSFQQAW
jgi:hypothetical protein